MPRSLYIHIPFCRSKCTYCAFTTYTDKEYVMREYTDTLIYELKKNLTGTSHRIHTIFIGGGTPTLLPVQYLADILKTISLQAFLVPQVEITIEANPNDITELLAKELFNLGINRVSLGVQTFDDSLLSFLGRKHSYQDIQNSIQHLKKAGFANISIDLIHGIPGQSLESWVNTLYKAIDLDIAHISCYGLKIESDTHLAKDYIPGELPIDDEPASDMYLKSVEILTQNHFNHYEICNFAKKNYASQHNLVYWNNEEYFGCGVGAHWFINNVRGENTANLEEYLHHHFVKHQYPVSQEEHAFNELMLGLRKSEGIDLLAYQQKFTIDLLQRYQNVLDRNIALGLMQVQNNRLSLSTQGFLLSNSILTDFMS